MQTTKFVVALGVSVLSMPAFAAPQSAIQIYGIKHVGDSYQVEVPYYDLDLRQPAQVRELSVRVNRAARTVCGPALYVPRLNASQKSACTIGAIEDAAPQIAMARKRAQEFADKGTSAVPEVAIAIRVGF